MSMWGYYGYMRMSVCWFVYMSAGAWLRAVDGRDSLGAQGTGGCEPPDMRAGYQIQVLWKGSEH